MCDLQPVKALDNDINSAFGVCTTMGDAVRSGGELAHQLLAAIREQSILICIQMAKDAGGAFCSVQRCVLFCFVVALAFVATQYTCGRCNLACTRIQFIVQLIADYVSWWQVTITRCVPMLLNGADDNGQQYCFSTLGCVLNPLPIELTLLLLKSLAP